MRCFRKLIVLMLTMMMITEATGAAEVNRFELPDALTAIREETFFGNQKVDTVILPDGVTRIESKAFAYSSVAMIRLPAKLTYIAPDAFEGCSLEAVDAAPGSYGYYWAKAKGIATELPASVNLDRSEMTLMSGDCATLIAAILPDATAGMTVNWSSSDPTVAVVDNGQIIARSAGTATITAETLNGIKAECAVTVLPLIILSVRMSTERLDLTVDENPSVRLSLLTDPENAELNEVSWSSSDRSVAIVDANGLVSAVDHGNAVITARTGEGFEAECVVTVSRSAPKSVELSQYSLTLTTDEDPFAALTAKLLPEFCQQSGIVWVSSDPEIATVDENGLVTGTGYGSTTVTAYAMNGVFASCEVRVTRSYPESIRIMRPETMNLAVGESVALPDVAFVPEDCLHKEITWSLGYGEAILRLDPDGSLRASGSGDAQLIAMCGDARDQRVCRCAFRQIVIRGAKTPYLCPENGPVALSAEIIPAGETGQLYTWSSSDPSVATVSADGTVTPLKPGTVTITVNASVPSDGKNVEVSDSCVLVIYPAFKAVKIHTVDEIYSFRTNDAQTIELVFEGGISPYTVRINEYLNGTRVFDYTWEDNPNTGYGYNTVFKSAGEYIYDFEAVDSIGNTVYLESRPVLVEDPAPLTAIGFTDALGRTTLEVNEEDKLSFSFTGGVAPYTAYIEQYENGRLVWDYTWNESNDTAYSLDWTAYTTGEFLFMATVTDYSGDVILLTSPTYTVGTPYTPLESVSIRDRDDRSRFTKGERPTVCITVNGGSAPYKVVLKEFVNDALADTYTWPEGSGTYYSYTWIANMPGKVRFTVEVTDAMGTVRTMETGLYDVIDPDPLKTGSILGSKAADAYVLGDTDTFEFTYSGGTLPYHILIRRFKNGSQVWSCVYDDVYVNDLWVTWTVAEPGEYYFDMTVTDALNSTASLSSGVITVTGEGMTAATRTSEKGKAFIKQHEGLRLNVYDDGIGNATIGYGHMLKANEHYTVITQAEADALFEQDLAARESVVNEFIRLTGAKINQQQYDALSSFFYNGNSGALNSGTYMFRLFSENRDSLSSIPTWRIYNQLANYYNRNDAAVRKGLFKRRCDEARVFTEGIYEQRNWTIPDWCANGEVVPDDWYPTELGNIGNSSGSDKQQTLDTDSRVANVVNTVLGSTYIKIYTAAAGNIAAYTSRDLNVRGRVGKEYSASIYDTDEIYLYEIGTNSSGRNYARIKYPVGTNATYYEAYIPLSAIIPGTGTTPASGTACRTVSGLYDRPSGKANSAWCVDSGDTVYLIGKNGGYCQILYPSSGCWRVAWCTTAQYDSMMTAPAAGDLRVTVGKNTDYMSETVRSKITGGICRSELDKGNVVIFLFEGCGSDSSVSRRYNATCVVVGKVNGADAIRYQCANCNTIPDCPKDPSKNGGDPMPTVMSGTYEVVTRNHLDQYASLRVVGAKVIRYRDAGSTGYYDTSTRINIHHRTNNDLNRNSTGCQNVGSLSNNFSEYTDFLKACNVITSGTWNQLVTDGVHKGVVVIDRRKAYDYLAAIYGATEANKIISETKIE